MRVFVISKKIKNMIVIIFFVILKLICRLFKVV